MIKKFLLPLFSLFTFVTFAQQGSASPYSFFGIGDVRFKGTSEIRAMGGVSIFADSIHLNLQNPASYSQLKYTSFTVGGTLSASKFNSYNANEKAQRTTLDYLAVGLPIGKFGVAFGLIPYSSVGYKIKNTDANLNTKKYTGDGGLNKAFAGIGYQVFKSLSIGADMSYDFGRIETNNINYLKTAEYGAQEKNVSEMSGLSINIGAMYSRKINKKINFYSGITYSPQANLKSSNTRNVFSILYSGDYTPVPVDYLESQTSRTTIKLPSKLSIGAGIGENKKWLLGTEVTFQQSSSFGNRFNDISNVSYENGTKYSLGGYFIPNYNAFSDYYKKITYRGGFRYETTGLIVNSESIRDYAFTGGFGLPLSGTFSNLNIGFEYGRRGTAKANLVEENYTNLIISLSLNDKWFVKSKYN